MELLLHKPRGENWGLGRIIVAVHKTERSHRFIKVIGLLVIWIGDPAEYAMRTFTHLHGWKKPVYGVLKATVLY